MNSTKPSELISFLGFEVRDVDSEFLVLALCKSVSMDSNWGPAHAKWRLVCNRIREQFRRELAADIALRKDALRVAWRALVMNTLTDEDVDRLLSFYRSPQGRRFVKLQNSLYDVFNRSIEDVVKVARSTDPIRPTMPEAHSGFDESRRDLFSLSLKSSFSRSPFQAPDAMLSLMWQIISAACSIEGSKLDSLRKQYASDLPAFRAFVHQPALEKLGVAALQAARDSSPGHGSELNNAVADFQARHVAEWESMYARS